MKKYLFGGAIFLLIFLSACNTNKSTEIPKTQQPFFIETKTLGAFESDIKTRKTAIIQSSSTLDIFAETSGRIENIFAKEGQKLKPDAIIATLVDTNNNFDLALQSSENALALQKANLEAQIVNADNAIALAEIQYKNTQQSYEHLLSRNAVKYDNLVQKNKNTIKTNNDLYFQYLQNLDALMTQYLHESDKIIGVSEEMKNKNDDWEAYLGAITGEYWYRAEDAWNAMYEGRGRIRARLNEKKTFSEENYEKDMQILSMGYDITRKLSNEMIAMLQNSQTNDMYLTQQMQNTWLSQWNNFRMSIQNSESQFINWKSQVEIFLENYQKDEQAVKLVTSDTISSKDFNALQKDKELNLAYKNANIETTQSLDNAKLAMEQALISLENAKRSKESIQKQGQFSLKNAEISFVQASKNASKLIIKTPITGIITKIHATTGMQVNSGTKIAEFSSSKAEALLEVDPRMVPFLRSGDTVTAKVGEKEIIGKIFAFSPIAGKNLLASVRLVFDDAEEFIGQSAVISFSLPKDMSSGVLLPLNAVKIISEGNGEIHVLQDEKIATIPVKLGTIYGSSIEIFTELPKTTSVILSDVSTFNDQKQFLQIKDSTQ